MKQNTDLIMTDEERKEFCKELLERLAALVQSDAEPVAWLLSNRDGDHIGSTKDKVVAEHSRKGGVTVQPLYLAPPHPDIEPYYRWKFALNDYQVGNLIDAIGQSIENGDWYGEFCNLVAASMVHHNIEKLGSNRGNEYTLKDIQTRNIRRGPDTSAGLIEATEQARDLLNGRHNVGSDAYKAFCILNAAISRARAAERSGK